jgi:hypothetical protein
VRGGPRRAPDARVHGGPATQTEGVRDLIRPSQISQPRTLASDGRQRARRRQGRRGGASPEIHRRTLSCCTGRQFVGARALHVAGEHASKPRGQGDGAGIHGGRRRKGAGRPRRRARGAAIACKEVKNERGDFAHHVKKRRASSRAKGRRQ